MNDKHPGLASNVVGLRGPPTAGYSSMGYGRAPLLRNGMNGEYRMKVGYVLRDKYKNGQYNESTFAIV